jgi:hypothetical protein
MKALMKKRALPREKEFKIAELQLNYDDGDFDHQRKGSHGLPEIKNSNFKIVFHNLFKKNKFRYFNYYNILGYFNTLFIFL